MKSLSKLLWAAPLLALPFLSACGDKQAAPSAAPAKAAIPVTAVTVQPERMGVVAELPGRVEAMRTAQVRARVPGIVLKLAYREGTDVKVGNLLYLIDPAPFQAASNSAAATLARAQASEAQAALKARRNQALVETAAISRQEYDDSQTALAQTRADVAAAQAALEQARLNLGYTQVSAPIAGRIGRSLVTEGALVGQAEVTPLATIQQLDPIYVTLTQSSAERLALQQALAAGKLKNSAAAQPTLSLMLEDGRTYAHTGKLLFSEQTVDESTGSVTIRAVFPNPERLLLPGMYARARIEQAVDEQAILVPQQSVVRNQDGASVLVVGADGKVASRPVVTGAAQGNRWAVLKGLSAGDQVVVEGLQKAKPGDTVSVTPWQSPSAQAPKAAAGSKG